MIVARNAAFQVATLLVAVVALAQVPTAPSPTPTPAPAPSSAAKPPTVRIVPPAPGSVPDPSQTLPLNPVEAVQTGPSLAEAKEQTENEFVIAPIPLSNPAIGSGLGFAAVYTLARKTAEKKTPPTTLGAGGFYTSNGSWAGGAGVKLYLKEDRYRVTLAAALGDLHYDLFAEGTGGNGIPIKQEFQGGLGEFMVGLGKRWYLGLQATYGTTKVGLRNPGDESIPLPPSQLDVTLAALGLKGERDSRDSVFYPTAGSRLTLLINHNDTAFGSDFTYTKTTVTYSDYTRLSESVVLAIQGAGCHASTGAAPFFDLCIFGTQNVLRGYTAGRYIDHWTVAAQAEARWRFARKWITTAFLGVGEVKPEYGPSQDTEVLPAAGVGLQWIAAEENMITVRVDYAVGRDGSHAFYVGIGQAF
jgi:hypothetical protein